MDIKNTIGNDDLVRIILWFCGKNVDSKSGILKEFESTTKLQKLVFIAQKESSDFEALQKNVYEDEPFRFSADNFGPYSVDLTVLLKKMKREGEIDIDKSGPAVCYKIKLPLKEKLSKIKDLINNNIHLSNLISTIYKANKLALSDLLKYIYQNPKYQEYIINSTIKDKFNL